MMLRSWLTLVVLAAAAPLGCRPAPAAPAAPASATTTVISLRNIDCPDCSGKVIDALRERPGFYEASFDKVLAELTVQHEPARLSADDILAVVRAQGYEGSVGPGQGAYLPAHRFDPGLDVQTISEQGEAVVLEDHLVAGKITVFDFYAEWCKPCRKVDAHMSEVLAAGDVALRKIDVVDWDSAVAQQHLGGVAGLPYVVVHGPDGKRIARIAGLDLRRLDAAIAKGRAQ